MISRRFLEKFVDERLVIFVILINSLMLCFDAFPSVEDSHRRFFFIVDYICTIYFVLEIIIKIRLHGWKDYWKSGLNKFDFTVVLMSSPLLLAPVFDTHHFSILLILRFCRLLRFLRVARFIPDRDNFVSGLKRALVTSVGVLITLVVYNFILSVGAVYLFSDIDPVNFGDPLIAMYNMFRVFTVDGWTVIPDAIAAKTTPFFGFFARAYFVFTVLTGGILGLSIANAVFVDQMLMDNNDTLEKKVQDLSISLEDLKNQMKTDHDQLVSIMEDIKNNK